MEICPYCASENIYFSKKKGHYICEDCDKCFDEPSSEKGMRIFISYGHDENSAIVSMIKDFLVEKGFDVWIDTGNIQKGQDWRESITNGLAASNGVLAFLTKHSVRDPGVCLDEIRIALRLKHSYVKSILLESDSEVKPPYHLTDRQWIDMGDWRSVPNVQWNAYFQEKMSELLEALESTETKQYEEDMKYISNTLNVYDTISKEQALLKEEFIGRKWMARQVQEWLETDSNKRMMLYGVPGSGKSAFAANFNHFSIDVIASLFISWDNEAFSSTDKVIRLLAVKLAAELNDYRRMLKDLLKKDRNGEKLLDTLHGSGLFDWLILDPLTCCIDGMRGRSLIIIDGLDEAGAETASLLFKKSAMLPDWIRVLFTSRYDEAAAPKYASAKTIILDSSEERNMEDIREYITKRLDIPEDDKRVKLMAEKIDGSFMYAKTLCDEIQNGLLSPDNISQLPIGLNDFYHDFFTRLFPERDDYLKIRPFLELLCVDEDLPDAVVRLALELDRYEFWELRTSLKSLVRSDKNRRGHKITRFIHKSISDWLQCRELSAEFYVNKKNGCKTLVSACERLKEDREKTMEIISDQADEKNVRYQIVWFENNYPLWLVSAEQFEKYRALLLGAFDREEEDKNRMLHSGNYSYYQKYYDLWRWAYRFPADEPFDDLKSKLKETSAYPFTCMVSEFSHYSFLILARLFKDLMTDEEGCAVYRCVSRFSDVFFDYMGHIGFSYYFRSRASDDSEMHDGWDKYYIAKYVNCCVKISDRMGISVPDSVRTECERLKLAYCYYNGSMKDGMFLKDRQKEDDFTYGLLRENEFYKDICTYEPENDSFKEQKILYNTMSLRFFFIYGEDEDSDFINKCTEHLADVNKAVKYAKEALEGGKLMYVKTEAHKASRLAYLTVLSGPDRE